MNKKNIIIVCITVVMVVIILLVIRRNKSNKIESNNSITNTIIITNENIKEDGYGNYVIVDENNEVIRENIPYEMLDVYKAIPDFDPNPSF